MSSVSSLSLDAAYTEILPPPLFSDHKAFSFLSVLFLITALAASNIVELELRRLIQHYRSLFQNL